MKILFSNPPWWAKDEKLGNLRAGIRAGSRWPFTRFTNCIPDGFMAGEYIPFPFFMGYAAAYAQKALPDAQVLVRDSIARRESYTTFLDYIFNARPDFVVIESATPSFQHDGAIIRLIAEASPTSRVILTGTIAASKGPELFQQFPNLIAIVKGEYERGVVSVIHSAGKHSKDWKAITEQDLLTEQEMNAAPPPMWDAECLTHYFDACPSGQLFPQLQIWTSRGCYFKCIFCAWPAVMTGNDPDGTGKRTVRCYSPEYVEAMVRPLIAQHGFRCIYVDDDIFNISERHTREMCAVLKRIGLPWSAMCRADTIKLDTWQLMKDSGCFGVKIGVESGCQQVVDGIVNKKLNLTTLEEITLPAIIRTGLTIHTTWTVGLPGETEAQQKQTVEMISRLYNKGLHHTHQLSGTALIEGTPLATLASNETKDGAPTLPTYPSATTRTGFIASGDGQTKIEEMQRAAAAPRLHPGT